MDIGTARVPGCHTSQKAGVPVGFPGRDTRSQLQIELAGRAVGCSTCSTSFRWLGIATAARDARITSQLTLRLMPDVDAAPVDYDIDIRTASGVVHLMGITQDELSRVAYDTCSILIA